MAIETTLLIAAAQVFAGAVLRRAGEVVFTPDRERRLRDIYLRACQRAFAQFPDVPPEELERLAEFFGSETVAEAASEIVTEGCPHHDRMAAEWAKLGGDPAEVDGYIDSFVEAYKREAMQSVPFDLQVVRGVLLSDLTTSTALRGQPPIHKSSGIAAADEAVSGPLSEAAAALEREIDDQVSIAKERRLYRSAMEGLERLAGRAALSAMGEPAEEEVLVLGDHVEGLLEAWGHAAKEEKRDLLKMMLEAVYVDVPGKKLVALQVKPAFKPLFRAWLGNEEPQQVSLRFGSDIVFGDPDGIRGLQQLSAHVARLCRTRGVVRVAEAT